ncbi:protein kinase domain-containing protein [Rhodococcus qingshengii]|uniref:protein kinase domain-containing protein n=1 Tax=Rhodococcus qingshengii TaxID=334542 RepID=UPI001AE08619|nr:protein kinase [Rhodococcus qingshengii]
MIDIDPFATQHDAAESGATELRAVGFESVEEIGRGGFGTVYRCREPSLDRTVAVKILTADLDEENRARFFREQQAAGRLTGHPNVVNVLHTGITDTGRPFIVMPYYAQDSLHRRLRRHAPLPMGEVLRIGVKIAGALASAHRLGVLHRDVKPGNILLTDYGEPALSDFGIAHFAGGFKTETGIVTGSPAFTAPEVVTGGLPSAAADVYGLGATLFAAITGHVAFERHSGEQLVAQFLRITSGPAPDPRQFGIADDVGLIIEEAMSADQATRPSAETLGQRLRESQHRHRLPVDEMSVYSARSDGPPRRLVGTTASGSEASSRTGGAAIVSVWSRTGELPLELTSFVDRRTELARAKNLLSTERLVTLTGIGGVGKTRLALRVAAKTKRSFADGVRLVELGELRDETLLPSVVTGALRIRDRSMRPVLDVLAEFLDEKELLLVLDNCEQVVAAVAQLAESLLRRCAGLKILATSREPIGVGGEAVLLVPPLSVPNPDRPARSMSQNDAVKLFVDRGVDAVPGFELAEENRAVITRICQKLDGLPLPIELAAARLRAMSVEQILARLTERYSLLTQGSRAAPSRQKTLQMCIDWSYDLCTPAEQDMWAQLSTFSGGFTLSAAEQVCDVRSTSMEFLDVVGFLVEKSILIREEFGTAVRFRMLDTLREYGRQKAQAAGVYDRLCGRHCDWCERLALSAEAEWIGPRQIEWINTIVREQSNVRDASEFCVRNRPDVGARIASSLLSFWISQGGTTEGRRWLSRFAEVADGPPTVGQAKAIHAAALGAVVQGDIPTAAKLVEAGRALARRSSDPLLRAHVDHAIGDTALFSGDFLKARTHLEKAADVYTERKLLHLKVMTSLTLGLSFELLNEHARAIECYEQILAITEAHGETMYRTYALWALAIAVWKQGDRDRAIRLLEKALRMLRKVNDRLNVSMCLQVLAWIVGEGRDSTRAAVLMGASEKISRSVGSSIVILPGLTSFQVASEQQIRRSLGEPGFKAAHRKGVALGLQEAIDFALGEQGQRTRTPTAHSATHLTKRELEVSELVAEGLTNKEIATRLVISVRTAQGHVEHVLIKLGFTSRAQIATWFATSKSEQDGG